MIAPTRRTDLVFSRTAAGHFIALFSHEGEWRAAEAAEAWLGERGFSVGRMQAHAPRGILFGAFNIQKWRNLSGDEIDALHGQMTGECRTGPIRVVIYCGAPADALRSLPIAIEAAA